MDTATENPSIMTTLQYIYNESATNVTENSGSSSKSVLKIAADVSITGSMVVIMLGMGCAIEWKDLIHKLRKPSGICVGMLIQFIIFPPIIFGFAHALQLQSSSALGMLIVGCSPSGGLSNILTHWVGGDVSLSVSMTAVSNLLALGMLPLNLFIYNRSWTDKSIVIPYLNVFISFALAIGPAIIGILIRWKLPKVAKIFVKCGSIAGVISVILVLTLISIQYPFMYSASWRVYIAALIIPISGFVIGYIVAIISRQDHERCRTISIESGVKNVPLYMTVIVLTFSKKELARISLCPLLNAVLTASSAAIMVIAYKIMIKVTFSKKDKQDFSLVSTQEEKMNE